MLLLKVIVVSECYNIIDFLIFFSPLHLGKCLGCTMWKSKNFSASQTLRDINFGKLVTFKKAFVYFCQNNHFLTLLIEENEFHVKSEQQKNS